MNGRVLYGMRIVADKTFIRAAMPGDAAQLTAIYAHYVLHSSATFEIVPPDSTEMGRRLGRAREAGWPWLVAIDLDGKLSGYAYAAQFRGRAAYRHACENSIYLRSDRRGRGIGKALLARLLAACEAAGFRQMIAVIAGGEDASVALHLGAGFRRCGTLDAVGRKFGRWIDVHYMQRALGEGSSAPPGDESR